MKKLFIVCLLLSGLFISGCGFLNPVQKKDSMGNIVLDSTGKPVIVAAGSAYMEKAQGVLQVASAFPMFGGIASGIAALLGVGVAVSNRVANNRKSALAATVVGVSEFAANYDKVKESILALIGGLKPDEASRAKELLASLSIKSTISDVASTMSNVRPGIWEYLDSFVQKIDPKSA